MGTLEKELPTIVKKALKEEDDVTRILVNTLLHQTIANQHKSSKQKIVQQALEDEIDKCISTGKVDEKKITGEN